jgi:hypothetical protein
MQLAINNRNHLNLCGIRKYSVVTVGKKIKNSRELNNNDILYIARQGQLTGEGLFVVCRRVTLLRSRFLNSTNVSESFSGKFWKV